MTQEQMIELARRAVSCKGWRWIPGMKAVKHEEHATSWFRIEQEDTKLTGVWADAYPDLADPATLGCFLWLVRDLTRLYTELTFEPGYLLHEVTNLVELLTLDFEKTPEEVN